MGEDVRTDVSAAPDTDTLKPVSLIPVGLREAALDSPTFRATVAHYCEQVDLGERWLDSFSKSATKLAQQVLALEVVVNPFLTSAKPPGQLTEVAIDQDYTLLAVTKYSEAAREFWAHAIGGFKKTQFSIIDPIKAFLQNEFRGFKDTRRQLETAQRTYDNLVSRYYSQSKTKEASSLREDAWQLHEAKKAYLKASMEFCVAAPLMRTSLDKLLIKVFSDHWLEMKGIRETETASFARHAPEIDRIRAWSKAMGESDRYLKKELLAARKDVEERAEVAARPSRELEDYAAIPNSSQRAPLSRTQSGINSAGNSANSLQGWMFMRTVSGKPARTYWVRRWFYVKDGVFGWLAVGAKSGGVEESEKLGVLLCNIRAAPTEDRRFCFEVKTKDTSLLLQTECQNDLHQWLNVFEAAKKKALEAPSTGHDIAFVVSPAVAPELAAKRADGRTVTISEEIDISHVPEFESAPRASFDITALQRPHQDNDGVRDGGGRTTFEIRRKSIALPHAIAATLAAPASGYSSSANASSSTHLTPTARTKALSFGGSSASALPLGSIHALTPATLVQPPTPTSLSRTALMVAAERGIDLGSVDASGGVPSSLMANQWGTANYGHLARVARGEIAADKQVDSPAEDIRPPSRRPSTPTPSERTVTAKTASSSDTNPSGIPGNRGHRQTLSDVAESSPDQSSTVDYAQYPPNYPQDLVVQDTQLRMLFPNVPRTDRVVLVCRGSWSINDHHNIPGRGYVTSKQLYFYSNHMGFVLVSGISLAKIIDVSMGSNSQGDVLYIRLPTRTATVHTYLESMKLLHRRLGFLVSNAKLEQPASTEEVLRMLTNMMAGTRNHSPGSDSWHNDAGRSSHLHRKRQPALHVNHNPLGGDSAGFHRDEDVQRFKLPVQPVVYAPRDMTKLASEAVFDVSAKSLFHIVFGDKSLVSAMLYFHRRTKVIKQYPWTSHDSSYRTREFEYSIGAQDSQGRTSQVLIVDSQTIEVANDHLCYVVTDKKSPWHLPNAKDFSLVTKIVITYSAKSQAKLAVYTNVQWHQEPKLMRKVIEQQALDDLQIDARDIVDLVGNQVRKLGDKCPTKRAVTIFGNIGQETEPKQLTAPDPAVAGSSNLTAVTPRSRANLFMLSLGTFLATAVSSLLMWIIAGLKFLGKALSTQSILTGCLFFVVAVQLFAGTHLASQWWTDRSASSFMARMGVGPNTVMSKAIYLHDIYDYANAGNGFVVTNASNQCSTAFQTILQLGDLSSTSSSPLSRSWNPSLQRTSQRLQRTRERFAMHRNDLLISLRLINNLEREAVHAQYENWLLGEDATCKRIDELISQTNKRKGAKQGRRTSKSAGVQGSLNITELDERNQIALLTRLDSMRTRLRVYCGDCRKEVDAMSMQLK